ncbi:MAG: hypothetical protein ACK5IN_01075 [Microbacterium sp.]
MRVVDGRFVDRIGTRGAKERRLRETRRCTDVKRLRRPPDD